MLIVSNTSSWIEHCPFFKSMFPNTSHSPPRIAPRAFPLRKRAHQSTTKKQSLSYNKHFPASLVLIVLIMQFSKKLGGHASPKKGAVCSNSRRGGSRRSCRFRRHEGDTRQPRLRAYALCSFSSGCSRLDPGRQTCVSGARAWSADL